MVETIRLESQSTSDYLVASANHDILGFVGASTATASVDLKQPDNQKSTSRLYAPETGQQRDVTD